MLALAAAIFSVLLVLTGAAKVARPHDVQNAIARFGLPRIPGIGVAIGVVEILVGVGSLSVQEVLWGQAVLYAAFALWVTLALRSNIPLASCGCLGRPDTPPSVAHVALNSAAALVSIGAFFGEPLYLESGFALAAQLAVLACGVFLSYLVLGDGARLAGVRRA